VVSDSQTPCRTLFTTSDKLNEALQMLKDYEERRIIPPGGEEELYQAKKSIVFF